MNSWEDKFKNNLLEVLYRPDQPRDELGRWTVGGGGAGLASDVGSVKGPLTESQRKEITEMRDHFQKQIDSLEPSIWDKSWDAANMCHAACEQMLALDDQGVEGSLGAVYYDDLGAPVAVAAYTEQSAGADYLEIEYVGSMAKGGGRALMKSAINDSSATGFGGVIELEAARDANTLQFYKKVGFTRVGKSRPGQGIRMRLDVDAAARALTTLSYRKEGVLQIFQKAQKRSSNALTEQEFIELYDALLLANTEDEEKEVLGDYWRDDWDMGAFVSNEGISK